MILQEQIRLKAENIRLKAQVAELRRTRKLTEAEEAKAPLSVLFSYASPSVYIPESIPYRLPSA